jgi:hypothetical protein
MRQSLVRSVFGSLVIALALAAPASAATTDVTIPLHVDFTAGETFADAVGFCPSGEAESFGFHIVGAGRATAFHLFKTLTCDDGSGTLTIRVNAVGVFGMGGTIGGWNVVSGTGAYEDVHGGGLIVGTGFEGGIDDLYTGRLTG